MISPKARGLSRLISTKSGRKNGLKMSSNWMWLREISISKGYVSWNRITISSSVEIEERRGSRWPVCHITLGIMSIWRIPYAAWTFLTVNLMIKVIYSLTPYTIKISSRSEVNLKGKDNRKIRKGVIISISGVTKPSSSKPSFCLTFWNGSKMNMKIILWPSKDARKIFRDGPV